MGVDDIPPGLLEQSQVGGVVDVAECVEMALADQDFFFVGHGALLIRFRREFEQLAKASPRRLKTLSYSFTAGILL
jgi:hypothetical protein